MPALLSRRALIAAATASALAGGLRRRVRAQEPGPILRRPIPSSGETIPAVGMGTWITFNVGDSARLRADRLEVLRTFFMLGGGMVDSSPMYGSSEAVVGWCLERLPPDLTRTLFSATKVWTSFLAGSGPEQMAESRRLWGLETFDVMQVHNLVDWERHLPALLEDKAAGRVRHVGITTSHGRRHDDMARIMETRPIDFVQLTYNLVDREAEDRLLPLARDRGLAVIVNRPFRQKALIRRVRDHPLPAWAAEFDAANWPQFLLKFILSHPAVTCVIPATTRVDHMRENMGALHGRLPDPDMRRRMIAHLQAL